MSTDVEDATQVTHVVADAPDRAPGEGAAAAAPAVDPDDPREQIEVGVLMPNGRLVGRRFTSRAEAEAWARPDEGEQVVEYNLVCECSV
jgi:hypothetical protein